MSQIGHLLFPCCIKQSKDITVQKDAKRFSTATQHIITTLVLAILLGGAAATAAYFLTQGVILYTAIAGGSAAALTLLVGYVALRCLCGRQKTVDQETEPLISSSKEKVEPQKGGVDPTIKVDRETAPLILPSNEEKTSGSSTSLGLDSASGAFPIDTRDIPYGVKQCKPVTQNVLGTVLDSINNKDFTEDMKTSGVVFYDPTNEIHIPFARLYQVLLAHPASASKREILMELFADALVEEYNGSGKVDAVVYNYIRYLDPELVKEVAGYVLRKNYTDTKEGCNLLTAMNVQALLTGYTVQKEENKERILDYQEITRAMGKECKSFAIGAALNDGSCYFHSLAQLLSQATGTIITEKLLREQCYAYLQHSKNTIKMDSSAVPAEARWSSKEIKYGEKKEGMPSVPVWGEQHIHGQIIADLYGVKIVTREALSTTKTEQDLLMGGLEKITTTTRYECDGSTLSRKEGRISLSDIGQTSPQIEEGTRLHVGCIGKEQLSGHFFPIFIVEKLIQE